MTSGADPTPGLLPALNELQLGPSSDIQGAALLLGHGLIWGWLLTPNPLSMQRHGQAMASHRVAKADVGTWQGKKNKKQVKPRQGCDWDKGASPF